MDTQANQPIASVAAVTGKAFVKNAKDETREIHPGDLILGGDVIVTMPGAHVELAFNDASHLEISPNDVVQVSADLAETARVEPNENALSSTSVEKIIQTLNREGDIGEDLEDPSAGLGGGGDGAGNGFVQLLRIAEGVDPIEFDTLRLQRVVENVTPLSFEFGTPLTDRQLPIGEEGGDITRSPKPKEDVPLALNDTPVGVTEDTPFTASLATNDTPSGDGGNVWSKTTDPANGTVTVTAAGVFTYTPNANFNGVDSFTYTITDADGSTSTATVTLNVGAVNDVPVAVADTPVGVTEDTPFTASLATNDTPSGDGGNVWSKTTDPANGTVTVTAAGVFTYTPNANFNGVDSFTYTITDADGSTSTATVTLNVGAVNDVPVAVADTPVGVTEDTPFTASLATNDTPSGDGGNVWSKTTDPANGTVTVTAAGVFTYTPNANFNGVDSFTYTITDADGSTSTATVTLNVGAVNDVPVAVADTPVGVTEDTPFTASLATNDTPSGDGGNVWSKTTDPANGTVTVTAAGVFTYTPNANFNGVDSFTYTITDADGSTSTATVTLNVGAVNDVPVAVADTPVGVTEDTPFTASLATNDTPSGDGGNVWSKTTDPANGTVTVTAAGVFTYTPNANFNGVDSFTYTITDADGSTSTATVTLNVGAVNDVPVAVADTPVGVTEDTPFTASLATNDTPSGDGGNVWSKTTDPANGTVTVTAAGVFTYTPNANFNGVDSFTYTITDADGSTSTATVTLNVGAVNDVPVAVADTPVGVTEDTPFTASLATNDTPSGDGGNVWSKTTDPANGTVTVTAAGVFTYTPNANFNGVDSFTYTITDADGSTSTATVTLNVGAVNDVPVAVADTPVGVTEDTPFTASLATNDTPSGDGGNVWSKTTDPANGTVTVTAAGVFTYTPNANFNGVDSFTYTITDADGSTSTATVTLNVGAVNDVPVAVADTPVGVTEDTPFTASLATNDTPSGDGGNVWSKTTDPANGTVTVTAAGVFTYTPNANFNGVDSFTYTITDADGSTSTATVTLNVGAVNDVPVAVADTPVGVTEDTPFTASLATNDTPSGDGGNVWSKTTDPANGTVTVTAAGVFTYTPNANFNGVDSFTYTITDADGSTSTATVTLNVGAVNDVPVAVADTPVGVTEDTPFTASLATNDTPSGDGGNVWSKTTDPANGTVTVTAAGVFTYTPNANFNGVDSFTYTITDADGSTSTATVTLNVGAVNDVPVAVADTPVGVTEDTPFTASLATNDTPSGDGGNVWSKTTDPANGTVTVTAAGVFTYTPNANFNGVDSFTYTITDADGSTSTATVTLNVGAVNDVPVAVADTPVGVTEDTPFTASLATNDTPSGDGGNVWSKTTDPANGTVTVTAAGVFTYTPNANFNGVDSFTYTITDADGSTSTATVTLNVGAVNDVPVAVADTPVGVTEDTPFTASLATNDTPSGDGGNVWSKTTDPANGTVTVTAAGVFTYTPNANFNGVDSFTYTITDADGSTSTATVTLNVGAVNDVPVAVADTPVGVTEDTPFTASLATNDTPSGDGGNVWSKTTDPANGTVTVTAAGVFTYTPNANFNGVDSFTYTITDADGSTSTATVTLNVGAVNDVPVAVADTPVGVTEDTPFTASLATNDTPSGDGGNVWSKTTDPANGTVTVTAAGVFTYTPNANFNGVDSFTYTITDADGSTSTATVTLNVGAVNDVPVAVADTPVGVTEDTPFTASLATNDTPSGDGGNVWSKTTDPANGTVTVTAAGVFTYTPNANFNGVDSFTYTITDADGSTSTATVTLNVGAVNDVPVAVADTPVGVTEDTPFTASLATNDTPSGDGGNVWSKTTDPANGTVTVTAAGVFTYTPNANFNGVDSFTYTITDADGSTSTATVTLNVGAVNDVPVAVADTPVGVTEDTPFTASLATNDTPSGDGGNVWSKTTDPANGTVTVTAAGVFTYTPNANFNGVDSFTYTITDADGSTSTATVTLNVGAVNDVPVAVADTPVGVTEDTPFTASLATNDTPSGDGGNVWSKTTDPANGTVTVTAAGVFTYTPNANFNGVDSFTYTITDADGSTSTATVTLNVGAVNDVPVAVADTPVGVTEDTPFTASLATNDTPSGDGGNVWSKTTDPANGTVTVTAAGVFTYTPNANFNGVDSFTYTITDADGSTSTATVTLNVGAVNDVPVAVADTPVGVTEDTPFTASLATNDTPSGDGGNVWSKTTDPANGTVTVTAAGVFTYTPNANFNGVDSFTYTITDADGSTSTATVTLNVGAVNDVPVAVADTPVGVTEDTPFTASLATNDTPSGDGGNVWSKTTDPANGTVTVTAAGVFTYTPNANFNGVDSFTYTITDADGSTSTATVTLNVGAVNDVPVAVADTPVGVTEDTPFTASLATNDTPSGDGGNVWSKTTDPANGTVTVTAAGVFTYTPNANFNGVDSFTYTITDADGSTSTATVTLNVGAVNDVPVAVADTPVGVTEDTPFTASLATNDTPSGDGGNVWSKTTDPANGTVTVTAAGVFTYTPNANFNGVDSFTYTITDADGSTSTATVTLNVGAVNDVPVAVADTPVGVTEDTPFTASLATNDTPSGDGGNVWSKTTDPANGTVTVTAAGVFTYTPNANFNGVDSFTYTITDADGSTSTATVTLNVGAVNDVPVAVADTPVGVTEDTPFTASLATNDTPSGDGGNVWSKTTDPANGTVTVTAAGVFTYTPNANFNGVDSFTYTITDADGSTSTATVTLNVGAVNDVPVAVADTPVGVTEDTPFTASLATNDTPSGDGGNVWSKTTDPANGTVTVTAAGVFTYTPNANFNGVDSFTYTITDADGSTSTATVTLNVGAVNDVPVAVADTPVGVTEDTPFTASLATNDTPSGDGGNVWSKTTDPANGTVTVTAAGVFTYTPNANFNGVDSFTYTITDADGSTSTATVTLNVGAVNDVPVAVADTPVGVTEDTPFTASLATNDTPSGDGGNVWSKTTDPANGTVTVTAAGVFTYTPNANFNGVDSFTYTITDADGSTSTATVTLNVGSVDDPFTDANETVSIAEDSGPLAGSVLTGTSSADGPVTVTTFTVAGNATVFNAGQTATIAGVGSLTINADGAYSFTPAANYNGPVPTATYSMSDGSSGDTSTLAITVTPVDDAPVNTVPAAQSTAEDTSRIFSSANGNVIAVADVDGGSLTTTLTATHGTLTAIAFAGATITGNGTGTVTIGGTAAAINGALNGLSYLPAGDYSGAAQITVSTTDSTTADVDQVNITVTPVADIPTVYAHVTSNGMITSSNNLFSADFNSGGTTGWTANGLLGNSFAEISGGNGKTQTEASLFNTVAWAGQTGTDATEQANFASHWTTRTNAGESADGSTFAVYNQGGASGSDDAQGFLQYTGAALTAAEKASTSYVISAQLFADASSAQANGIGFVFGYVDDNNYFLARWENPSPDYAPGGSQFNGYPGQYQELSLVQVVSGVPIDLAKAAFAGDDWFNLNISVSNTGIAVAATDITSSITVSLNYSYGTVTGGAATAPALNEVGFYTFDNDSAVRFDNLTINSGVYSYTLNTEAYLNDTDGSETLSAVTLTGIPSGVTLMDGATSIAITGGTATIQVGHAITMSSATPLADAQINGIMASVTATESVGGSTAIDSDNAKVDHVAGSASDDWLAGTAGNNALTGGNGNDVLIGGAGNDTLDGGLGADVLRWRLGETGTDTVNNFGTTAGTDALDLRDLLVGELHGNNSAGNLASYLHFTLSGGNTTVSVNADATGGTEQTIVLQGIDLVSGFTNDQQIIQSLLNNNKLIVD